MYRKHKHTDTVVTKTQQLHVSQPKPKCAKSVHQIHDAISEGKNSCELLRILERGITINDCDDSGNTPLHIAALTGNLAWVQELIKRGATVECLNRLQESPMMVAAKNAHIEIVNELINIGTDVNQRNEKGETSLHCAIMGGSLKCVRLLLEAKSKINCLARNETGTPLTLACQLQKVDIVQELVNYRGPPRINLNTADHSTNGRMPIHWAVHTRNVKCLNILVKAGAGLDVADSKGLTPLVQSITEGSAEVLEILIEAGCDRMAVDGLNGTTLTLSALLGHTACLKVLLKAHEDPNEFGHFGLTPLSCATFESNTDTVNALLENGADPNIRSRNGISPLMVCLMKVTNENAAERHRILVSLIRGGSDVRGSSGNPTMFSTSSATVLSPTICSMSTGYISMLKIILVAGGVLNCAESKKWATENDLYDPCCFFGTFCYWYKHPKSLKVFCRWAVRSNIHGNMQENIKQLPLPEKLKQYLKYIELENFPIQKANTKHPFQAPMMSMLTRAGHGIRTLRGTLLYEAING